MKSKLVLLALVALALLVVGCGGGAVPTAAPAPAQQATTAPAPAQQATTAPAGQATTAPASNAPVTVTYWSLWNEGEPQADVLKGWMADYTKAHPNVTFNVTWAGRDILTKLQTAISGGQKVDLVDHEGPALRGALVVKGLTMPLDKYLKETMPGESGTWESIFVPNVLDKLKADDGTRHVIPYEIITTAIQYDQRLFDSLGVKPANTWDEFMTLCETIKGKGKAPLTQDAGVDFYNAMWYYTLIERFDGPGALLKAAEDKTGAAWDAPEFLQAAKMERDLWTKGYIIKGAEGFAFPAGQMELAQGNAAMELVGTWLPNEVKASVDPNFAWRSFMVPNVPNGKGSNQDVELYPLGWVILKDGPNATTAADFIRFSMSKDRSQQISDVAVNLSARKDTTPPKALADSWNAFTNAKQLFLPYDGINSTHANYYKNVFLKYHDQMFLGKITPEDFIKQIKQASIDYWKTNTD